VQPFSLISGNRTVLRLLAVIVIASAAETFGKLTTYLDKDYNRQWFYNLTGILDFLVIFYIYYRDKLAGLRKSIIKIIVFLVLISIIIEGLVSSSLPFMSFLNYSFCFMSVMVSIYCLTYLWKLVRSDQIIVFSELSLFWASIGLLFYSICTLPLTVFINKLAVIDPNNNLFAIQTVSSLILYSCYIIGFICSKSGYNN